MKLEKKDYISMAGIAATAFLLLCTGTIYELKKENEAITAELSILKEEYTAVSTELDYLSEEKIQVENKLAKAEEELNNVTFARSMTVCEHGERKSFMDFRAITNVESTQYKLQQLAHTGNYGIRQYQGYYLVAMGSKYAKNIGDRYLLILENGMSVPVMIGDVKQDIHTYNQEGCVGANNKDIVEFIYDGQSNKVPEKVRLMGSYHAGPFPGKVAKIIKL